MKTMTEIIEAYRASGLDPELVEDILQMAQRRHDGDEVAAMTLIELALQDPTYMPAVRAMASEDKARRFRK